MFSQSGSSRTVLRILTACLLSSLALLGFVSTDLTSSFSLLHSTEEAYDELTSCRTRALLHIVTRLQNIRHLFAQDMTNETLGESLTSFDLLCDEMAAQRDGHGLACRPELTGSCQEMSRRTEAFLSDSFDGGSSGAKRSTAFTLAIERLLNVWETVEHSVVTVKQNSNWRYVLSARLLVTFTELNHQLMLFHNTTTSHSLHRRWTHTLSYLSFARVLTEQLNQCWLEHIDLSRNSSLDVKSSSVFDTSLWQISGSTPELLSGSLRGIQTLRNTQKCLFDRAASNLRLRSRSISSSLSMRICLLAIACLIYPVVMVSFKQMIDWIQNYAQTLKEKTEDLKHQRQLAEDLLHQMLPKSVARQLRRHKHVEAESYERVTIFFSDIVGFTSISASCTPLQVVEMLNNLYMCFDTRIESYDVYKVETIGDAYMVVSGLPERNGDKHADEIAKMALDLVAAVRQVTIPHMPKERLQLRAGIHTGPCVAGIVGYKMPRYCLFGDTVNTASRMESTSLPQKIHTSSETYLALIKDNAYELQLRGEIEVKGKGKMNTYWLVGHKNYSVQNDSLVCHWNPSMARKKKPVAGSLVSVGNVR
uniref:guanylate cyclase n=1 Tax=Oryzias sinensis TaxID=183150 RepID=A0A8C7YY66_9TELE